MAISSEYVKSLYKEKGYQETSPGKYQLSDKAAQEIVKRKKSGGSRTGESLIVRKPSGEILATTVSTPEREVTVTQAGLVTVKGGGSLERYYTEQGAAREWMRGASSAIESQRQVSAISKQQEAAFRKQAYDYEYERQMAAYEAKQEALQNRTWLEKANEWVASRTTQKVAGWLGEKGITMEATKEAIGEYSYKVFTPFGISGLWTPKPIEEALREQKVLQQKVELEKGIAEGGWGYVRDKPVSMALIFGSGYITGKIAPFLRGGSKATIPTKFAMGAAGATYVGVKGLEVYRAEGYQAKGKILGGSLVEVGLFTKGYRLAGIKPQVQTKVTAKPKSYIKEFQTKRFAGEYRMRRVVSPTGKTTSARLLNIQKTTMPKRATSFYPKTSEFIWTSPRGRQIIGVRYSRWVGLRETLRSTTQRYYAEPYYPVGRPKLIQIPYQQTIKPIWKAGYIGYEYKLGYQKKLPYYQKKIVPSPLAQRRAQPRFFIEEKLIPVRSGGGILLQRQITIKTLKPPKIKQKQIFNLRQKQRVGYKQSTRQLLGTVPKQKTTQLLGYKQSTRQILMPKIKTRSRQRTVLIQVTGQKQRTSQRQILMPLQLQMPKMGQLPGQIPKQRELLIPLQTRLPRQPTKPIRDIFEDTWKDTKLVPPLGGLPFPSFGKSFSFEKITKRPTKYQPGIFEAYMGITSKTIPKVAITGLIRPVITGKRRRKR